MKIISIVSVILLNLTISIFAFAQTNPAITRFLQNTTVTARHYVSGNYTPINDAALVNVQSVKYSTNFAYITTTGLPSYVTGPFLDGNPNLAGNQNAIFKFPLSPVQNTGTLTSTGGGNIGVFINGVALFDYRDGVSWKNSSGQICGGPIMGCTGDGVWNRDAVVGEKGGFDCAKGHPAGTNYHHHQNPSAFNLDLNVISSVCNLYNADGLYVIDSSKHSPLLGFAYDGFPIYGAYAYKNVDATGGIVRMKSSFTLRNITVRNTYYNGQSVTSGPPVNSTYPLGYFKEDYQYNTTSSMTPDYLDIHNGRFCITPEYPNGIYCYFATVDANWNSAYPYVVGPTYYGVYSNRKVASITESVTTYPINTSPSIYIAAFTKTICSGTSVAFTAATYNAGLNPSYQWKVNGNNVGTNSSFFSSSSLANNDQVSCTITKAISITSTSNSITMSVTPSVLPSVFISTNAGTICYGTNVTFTAVPTNGGISPSYQWKKNGNNVGSNATTYSDNTLVDGDSIRCIIYGNATCATTTSTSSNSISIITNCATITLNVKCNLEGPYTGNGTMSAIADPIAHPTLCDTITVRLNSTFGTHATILSASAALDVNGNASIILPSSFLGTQYYISIKHRNSIETWSKSPISINSSVVTYDFRQ